MSTQLRNDDDELADNDRTDELPVLADGSPGDPPGMPVESTSEFVVVDQTWFNEGHSGTPDALRTTLAERTARLKAIERELELTETRLRRSEQELLATRAAAAELETALNEARIALGAHSSADVEIKATLEARDTALDALRVELAGVSAERDSVRAEIAATPTLDDRLRKAQEELLTLGAYIENRQARWQELEAQCTRQEQRIAELELKSEAELELDRRRAEERAAHEAAMTELKRELAEARGRLEQSRNDVARLERTLSDKDRALALRDERLKSLEHELEARRAPVAAAAPEGSVAPAGAAPTAAGSDAVGALREPIGHGAAVATPLLVYMDAGEQRRHSLATDVVTIGRGPNCDIQILAQFVSREHARLVIDGKDVIVEDLGSTNGVFVNAARIARQALQHGDLMTIGETQFRFLEATRH